MATRWPRLTTVSTSTGWDRLAGIGAMTPSTARASQPLLGGSARSSPPRDPLVVSPAHHTVIDASRRRVAYRFRAAHTRLLPL